MSLLDKTLLGIKGGGLQLVEAFRGAGKAKHRTLVTLGRLDQLTDSLDSVISGLLKVPGPERAVPAVEFESARALGNVWALNELWESLGFGELRRVFRKGARCERCSRHGLQSPVTGIQTGRVALAGNRGDAGH